MNPHPTPLYHITSVRNLPSILREDGLQCSKVLTRAAAEHTSIAYSSIQERRARTIVPCGPGGTVHDYVPFFFAPRPPMLYAIKHGNVAGAVHDEIVYLVTGVESVKAAGCSFVFTDGHAIMSFTEFYDDPADLDKVDWPLMRARMWHDTADDPDRKRRRQAEFLVHRLVPWEAILEIGVINDTMRTHVLQLLQKTDNPPVVRLRPDWYY